MLASKFETQPVLADWMAPTESCGREELLQPLEHDHHNSYFIDGSLASAVCRVELPLPEGFMEKVDTLREHIFTKSNVDTMVQSGGNAALTAYLCSGWHIDYGNLGFVDREPHKEDGKSFQAISTAYNSQVPTMGSANARIKAVDRFCWGFIKVKDDEFEFDPDRNRATIVGMAIDAEEVVTTIIEPARGVIVEERSMSAKYLLGQVVNTQIIDDPYAVTLSLLDRASKYEAISRGLR